MNCPHHMTFATPRHSKSRGSGSGIDLIEANDRAANNLATPIHLGKNCVAPCRADLRANILKEATNRPGIKAYGLKHA